MANPSKSTDPAAAAMSAIEEALNLVDLGPETDKRLADKAQSEKAAPAAGVRKADGDAMRLPTVSGSELSAPAVQVKAPEANGARLRDEIRREEDRKNAEPAETAAQARPAANDDRPSVGQILQSLQQRPSRTPYVLATLVSLAWLGTAGFYVYTLKAAGSWPLPVAQIALLALVTLGPVAFFFATASLARRSQEMRMTARSMQQVAIRLAEPETVATEQVVTLSQAIRREVASMGDGIERALARASELENVLRSEVTNLERSYGDNERRIRSLIDELASEREAIIGNADRLRQSISGAHEKLSHELESTSVRISETVGEAGSRVTSTLGSKAEEINLMLARSGDSIVERIGAQSDSVAKRLTESTSNVTQALSQTGNDILTRIQSQGETFTANLTETGNSVADRIGAEAARIMSTIDEAGAGISRNLSETSVGVSVSFAALGDSLVSRLNTEGENVAANVNRLSDNLVQGLDQAASRISQTIGAGDELATRLSGAADRLSDSVSVRGAALETALSAASERIETTFAERTQAAADVLEKNSESVAARISGTIGKLSEDLALQSVGLEMAITAATDRIDHTLTEKSRGAVETLQSSGEEIVNRLAAQAYEVYDRFTASATDAVSAIGTHGDRVNEALVARIGAFETSFAATADAVAGRVEERARDAAALMDRQLAEFNAASTQRTQSLSEAFERYVQDFASTTQTRAQDLSKTLDESARGFSEVAARSANELSETLRDRLGALENAAANRTSALEETLSGLIEKIDTGLGSRLQSMSDSISRQAQEASRVLDQSARQVSGVLDPSAIEATISAKIRDLNVTLAERSREVLDNLREGAKAIETALDADALTAVVGGKVGEIRSVLSDHSRDLVAQISENARTLREAMDPTAFEAAIATKLAEVEQTLAERSRAIVATIESQAATLRTATDPERLEGYLGDRIADLNSAVAQRNTELLSTLVEGARAVERALSADALEQMLTARVQEISETLEAQSDTLNQSFEKIAQRGADIVNQATNAADSITTSVNASGEALREAIENSAAASVRSLLGANERLKNDLPAILEHLAATNRSLEEIIEQAGSSFTSIEGSLGERIQDFRHSLGTIFNQVDSLGRTADAAVDSASSLSQRLENQSRELAEAATVLAQTQLQLDGSLATRQASLEQLLEDVQGRTQGFESAVQAFTGMIEDAFSAAEKRSRDIGLFLASETRNVAGAIGKQYEEVRSASEAERERTLEAMRASYAAMVAEMNKSFELANERFRDSAKQMRSVTADIHRELDATREELRRGALELPKETAEQTAAVRRVVADQVRALNELTSIVDRSARTLERTGPSATRPEPQRTIAAFSPTARAPLSPPPVAPPLAKETPVRSPAPAARNEKPAPAKTEDHGAGWLSELLERASREDGARQESAVADIARNIGRYLDHEAAVSVWERYYRGDQNVFTRDIYSAQGQLAFEEARRRYRSDRPFREAVDRFAEDFENEVQKIGRDDRDGSRIRAALTSENGKAYTLLAHAAGRFDAA